MVGAFLFSLVGGILWFVLYQVGFIASISGFVAVICAVKGYTFFAKAKDESTSCIVLSSIIAALVLIISWYICASYDLYKAYQEWFAAGEVDFTLTFFESVRALPYFFEDSEILIPYLKDLGLGLLFAVGGAFSYVSGLRKKQIMKAAAEGELPGAETLTNASDAIHTEAIPTDGADQNEEVKNTNEAE